MPTAAPNKELTVLRYVMDHPGTTNEGAIAGLKETFSRVTVFNTLTKLKEYDMIDVKKDRPNSQTQYLSINDQNIIVKHIRELDEFERTLVRLLRTTLLYIEEKYFPGTGMLNALRIDDNPATMNQIDEMFHISLGPTTSGTYINEQSLDDILFLLFKPIDLFFSVVDTYLVMSTIMWPAIIDEKDKDRDIDRDRETLTKLSTLVFSRFTDIQLHLSNFLRIAGIHTLTGSRYIKSNITRKLRGTELLDSYKRYQSIGINDEIGSVLDVIWKINYKIQELAYPEPSQYGWGDFVYRKDDWRKLLSVESKRRLPSSKGAFARS
jgi:hypothetical protein